MEFIDRNELRDEMESENDLMVVNALSQDSYEQEHIPGSVNVPIDDPRFIDRVEALAGATDIPVIVYCAGPQCPVARRAAELPDHDGRFMDVLQWH